MKIGRRVLLANRLSVWKSCPTKDFWRFRYREQPYTGCGMWRESQLGQVFSASERALHTLQETETYTPQGRPLSSGRTETLLLTPIDIRNDRPAA